jgi:DNA-binding transcriptional LysR family regulator
MADVGRIVDNRLLVHKCAGMKNWDDIRYFLAVARGGSVRAAADALGVNHSTVIRRIVQLEKLLGSKVFEKLSSGYRLTPAGAEIVDLAEQMEAKSDQLETRIFGRDQGMKGKLRITLAPALASGLLMPDIAAFSASHPEIEIEVAVSQGPVNLVKREADVALRVVYETSSPPPHLNGARLRDVHGAVYAARALLEDSVAHPGRPLKWLLWAGDWPPPAGANVEALRMAPVPARFSDTLAQAAAARAGMGIAPLPCFVGDADPELVRVPGSGQWRFGTLWLLTHGEARRTRRVKLFSEFLKRRLSRHTLLLAGLQPRTLIRLPGATEVTTLPLEMNAKPEMQRSEFRGFDPQPVRVGRRR